MRRSTYRLLDLDGEKTERQQSCGRMKANGLVIPKGKEQTPHLPKTTSPLPKTLRGMGRRRRGRRGKVPTNISAQQCRANELAANAHQKGTIAYFCEAKTGPANKRDPTATRNWPRLSKRQCWVATRLDVNWSLIRSRSSVGANDRNCTSKDWLNLKRSSLRSTAGRVAWETTKT
uniref:Uncharacterized protein n=1 Tax=Trichuris muris TaxID=70415 RepID=A0A5S6QYV2_TRIMR